MRNCIVELSPMNTADGRWRSVAMTKMAAPMDADDADFSQCSLKDYFLGDCGPHHKFANDKALELLQNCNRSISGHLRMCKLGENEVQDEADLIAKRAGIWRWTRRLDRGITICPFHRYTYGIGWKPSVYSKFTTHHKRKAQRGMTAKMCELTQFRWGTLCRVGTGICRQCIGDVSDEQESDFWDTKLTEIPDILQSEKCNKYDAEYVESSTAYSLRTRPVFFNEEQSNSQTLSMEDTGEHDICLSQTTSNWSDETNMLSLEKANSIMSSLNVSPLRSQMTTNISSARASSIYYYKRKANESIDSLLDNIAPGQGPALKEVTQSNTGDINALNEDSEVMTTLLKLYEDTANNTLKTQILSVISDKYSKTELVRLIPGLTTYKIEQARFLLKANRKGLVTKENLKINRKKMNEEKLQHAVSFFSDPAFMQLVSFGTRDLHLDSGETISMPDVVRTVCHSQIIQMYFSFCKDTEFVPLGKLSLFKILNVCEAAKRKNLHGLDNIAAEGVEGFQEIEEIIGTLKQNGLINKDQYDEMKVNVAGSKLYLKTDFKLHVQETDLCADHCIQWLLSDPNDVNFCSVCDHEHDLQCDRCELIKQLEVDIRSVLNSIQSAEVKLDLEKDLSDAIKKIFNWKAHIIRTVHQDTFRQDMLEKMEEHQAMVIMDWAMKFLLMKYREKQTDWFGQRGKNWHISVCIYRNEDGEIRHRTFAHVMESVKQDWFAVASLVEHVLETVKCQIPKITEVFLRSDNAGCYHCGHIWLSIPGISQRTGVTVKRYCYSEPQSGKSYCDSKIAHMRTKMRTYVATGKNILNAEDMKTAIDDGNGVSGCQVACVGIDRRYLTLKAHKLTNVNQYSDICFLTSGYLFRKAYNIGKGFFISKDEAAKLGSDSQIQTGCIINKGFSVPVQQTGKIYYKRKEPTRLEVNKTSALTESSPVPFEEEIVRENDLFFCPESGCTKVYTTYKGLEDHVLLGKHLLKLDRESSFDFVRRQWANLCNNVVITNKTHIEANLSSAGCQRHFLPMGWALRKQKSSIRFSKCVKDFLLSKFLEGKNTGKKSNPRDVAYGMRSVRDSSGTRVFRNSECLNERQITSYFSRLSANKEHHRNIKFEETEDEDLLCSGGCNRSCKHCQWCNC